MDQTLGKRIAANRKRLGLTQDQLAEQMGVTPQAVSKWENDQSCPDITALPKLAELFSITTDELLGHETNRPSQEAEIVEHDDEPDQGGIHLQKGKWEFRWDGGKKHAIGFAVWVMAVGILYLCTKLLNWDATLWDILWPSAMAFYGLFGVFPRFSFFRLFCGVFGSYFLISNLGVWDLSLGNELILPLIIILWGISLLVDTLRKKHKKGIHIYHNGKKLSRQSHKDSACSYIKNGDSFHCEGSFCDDRHNVTLPVLNSGQAEIHFGQMVVDLSDVESVGPDCSIYAECSFGHLTLLVPRKFRINTEQDSAFGSVNQTGEPDVPCEGEIRLHAEASFGEINVEYI